MTSRCLVLAFALALVACSSDDTEDTGTTPGDGGITGGADADTPDVPEKPWDGGMLVPHDAGGPISCTRTCDCPQGLGCVSGTCRSVGTPVFCCDKEGCPMGQQCLDTNEQPDICEGDPEEPDAGPGVDAGPGAIGDYCEEDVHCDQSLGLTCWDRNETPFWGHCTLEGCNPSCPAGTGCIQISDTPVVVGCMVTCNVDTDCRSDAHCFEIQGASFFGVCIPDCRDDFFDCSPRDGSLYCDPATGRFIPSCPFTPSQDSNAEIGDACQNSTMCAPGDICLGEFAWGFDDGMCTRVCAGLPEASACPAGSTCQMLPPPNQQLGFCYKECVGAMCPDRPGALCTALDSSWTMNGCIPP